MVTLSDVQAARDRIAPYVRRTPLIPAAPLKHRPFATQNLSLKLESLQVSGSFKARGAVNKLRTLSDEQLERGIITASGGNHGLAVAYAGWLAQKPAVVYLPTSTPSAKADKLREWGARVVVEGSVWDEANEAALAEADRTGMAYVHPFADPAVIAGQGTIALEILEDEPTIDTLVVAIGGGGLISGVSLAAKALKPSLRVIGVEATGAPTLRDSLDAGKLITLDHIATRAGTLAPRKSAQINLDIIRENVDDVVLVSDEAMVEAAHWLWFEMGLMAEMSGAAAMAALLSGALQTSADERVCVLVCGAGLDWL
jgi:threonine dehydratase